MPKLCGIISDKPKHKNSNKIPGFNQITIWGLQTDKATGGYCLAFFPLYVICLCPFPQGSLCISAFHFPFYLFVCCCSWLQLPSGTTDTWGGGGGGGGLGERSRHACSHSFEVFSCLLEIHGNMLSCQKYGFCLKGKNNNKKQQQPRLIKKNWCGNFSESVFGHSHCACAKATHIQFCSWKVSLNVQKTEQKRCFRHRAKEVYF